MFDFQKNQLHKSNKTTINIYSSISLPGFDQPDQRGEQRNQNIFHKSLATKSLIRVLATR